LRKFLELAVQVNRLKVLREQSRRKLDEYLIPVREVQGFAEDELNKLESTRMVTSSQDLILANNLSDPVDGYSHRTWFDLLEQAMEMKSVLQFRRAVLEGAKGLGSVGLAQILTPNKNYSTEAIRDEVLSRAGRYYLDGNESEGNWWQAVDNIWDKAEDKFRFRIFPWLEDTLWKSLGFENLDKKEFEALRTKIGALGLRVLAVDIANIGKKNIVKAPQELLDPLKSIIKKQFKIWDLGANPGDFTGKLNVVLAGVGGESMARDPLLAIGLDEKEIGELMNYYDLINLA
jgi:hypothetical protein